MNQLHKINIIPETTDYNRAIISNDVFKTIIATINTQSEVLNNLVDNFDEICKNIDVDKRANEIMHSNLSNAIDATNKNVQALAQAMEKLI